jgi:hypothetical protein|nr:MAG TPA_asm: Protein of unknown function (DUF1617) [Caudoviricetes sp.]
MTIENAHRARAALNKISHSAMPAKTAYKISKLSNFLKDDANFYTERLSQIIEQYGEKDENGEPVISGNGYKIQEDKTDECAAAIKELSGIEATTPGTKIYLSELDNVELSPDDIAAIYDFIEED